MISFKKILAPVDFSEASKKAVTYGLTLADQFKARLIIAHIVPDSATLAYAFPIETFELEKKQVEDARRAIDDLVPAEYKSRYDIQTIVKTGAIDAELLAIVQDESADLVVMGMHGRRTLGRWFIGSVKERMLRKVPVPVLTVSHVDTEKHTIQLVSFKRILYATDLSESSNTGLKYAIELARAANAQLTVLHSVYYRDQTLWAHGAIPEFESERAKLTDEIREKVSDAAAPGKPGVPIETLVVQGKPYEKIVETAEERGMDLIVMNLQSKSTLERALIGSTAERVVRLATIPVLSVPRI